MTPSIEKQLVEFRALDNIEHVDVISDDGMAILVRVVPIPPTATPVGDWAQPSEPFLMTIRDRGAH